MVSNSKQNSKRRGQALTEFALIAPLLLFLVLGIIDFGRTLFTYAMGSNALRDAVRYAEVLGYSGGVPRYLDCAPGGGMDKAAHNIFFVNEQVVTIEYIKADDPTADPIPCASATPETLENGDLLVISSKAKVSFITPFLSQIFHEVNFDFKGQRTIVKEIALNSDNPLDTDYDGLDDLWEQAYFGDLVQTGTDDPDSDGCNNGCEETRGLDPNNPDSDNDTLKDGDEVYTHSTDPILADTDGDGLWDGEEINRGTDPNNPDSDGDGLTDGEEVNGFNTGTVIYFSNPLDTDSDDDTISDYDEVHGIPPTNPSLPDTDADGLLDAEEEGLGTNPTLKDTDGDGLDDFAEVKTYLTNPLLADSDNDGLTDKEELVGTYGYTSNPLWADSDGDKLTDDEAKNYHTSPKMIDTDTDSVSDYDEVQLKGLYACLSPIDKDSDDDTLTDGEEINTFITDPCVVDDAVAVRGGGTGGVADSDGDGLLDVWEMTWFHDLTQDGTGDPDNDTCDNACEQYNGTNPLTGDSDGDGLTDNEEIFVYATDPKKVDTDGDGLKDGEEIKGVVVGTVTYTSDPLLVDTDTDGLTDYEEVKTYLTNPKDTDTDDDGLSDYAEVKTHLTNPLLSDTDADGLKDGVEVNTYLTNPLLIDTDGDTLKDGDEVNTYKSSPTKKDTDGEGLADNEEVLTYLTDPSRVDTDGDTLSDYDEVMTYKTSPKKTDTDSDGIADNIELQTYQTNPLATDTDGDGLSDPNEIFVYISNPKLSDTDADGLNDGLEVNTYKTSPLLKDSDNDTTPNTLGNSLSDYDEVMTYLTNPLDPDTDHDSVSDYDEIFIYHTNPRLQIDITIADVTNIAEPGNKKTSIVTFTVSLSDATSDIVTVDYYTQDGPMIGGAASGSGGDYVASRGTLTFDPGTTQMTISITVNGDSKKESAETFYINLINSTYAYIADNQAIGTILAN
jgi:hypothetical protein